MSLTAKGRRPRPCRFEVCRKIDALSGGRDSLQVVIKMIWTILHTLSVDISLAMQLIGMYRAQ